MAKSCQIKRCVKCGRIIQFHYRLCYSCNQQEKFMKSKNYKAKEFKGSLKHLPDNITDLESHL